MKKITQKTFSEIYESLRKKHFPKEKTMLPAPGSFNDELMKRCYEAGYDKGFDEAMTIAKKMAMEMATTRIKK